MLTTRTDSLLNRALAAACPESANDADVVRKFETLFALLQENVSPYSRRFLNYWDKVPARKQLLETSASRRGVVRFDDAWKLLTAFCFTTGAPHRWRDDIPALVTHWLSSPSNVSGMVDSETTDSWRSLLAAWSRLGEAGFKVTRADSPLLQKRKEKFRFIDLFAGVGGFRLAMQEAGGHCVFSSEWDQKARETYFQNYGEWPFGDLTGFTGDHRQEGIPPFIPAHDILTGGFPCQPFSQAGQKLGFDDARGTLFFDILKIARARRPAALFLENVKGLKGHNKGHTFRVICKALEESGYSVYSEVLSAKDYGVPQNRQRIFIVAFRDKVDFRFPDHAPESKRKSLDELLEKNARDFTISDRMWTGHRNRKARHRSNGNGFGYSLFKRTADYVNTISARYWKDGSEILIHQPRRNPRTLTPRECARLQGFPDTFRLHTSKRANYQQFGNSVAVPVIKAIAKEILKSLDI
ncbi:MAG: DNA cytosine methyltransferase [Planctomycetota bacterium]